MSSSTVSPYQFFEELRRVCPGKFGPNAVPGNINPNAWKALDLFSSIGNITHDVELTTEDCNMLPNFDTVEQVVRFVFAGVLASKNHKDILTQYNELEAVKAEAVKKLGYTGASLAIDTNPVLAVGIYLLYGYGLLDQLKPVASTLSAIMEVSNLLPKEIREKYGEYVIYASMAFKKEIKEKPTGAQAPQKPAEKPQQELPVAGEKKAKEEETKRSTLQDQVAELIDRALRYCNQVVKTKPGFPIPDTVKMYAVYSLASRLDRYGIKSFDVDAIDVQEVDCQTIYDEAVSNYESKYDGNRQYWASSGGGEIARKLAATLAEIIAERVGKEATEEEAESMEEKYTEMGQEEEEKLSAVEDLLNELYSAVSGERKRLGLKPDQIPDFLMEYLSILNQAGLSPQEYSELGKMFATFVQVAKEAGLSPKDYKGLLDRIIVLPPNVRKGIASAVVSILDKYSAGTIDANEAVSEIANLLGVKVGVEEAKPQEVEEVPQPPKVQPSPPRVPRVRRTERREEEEVEETIPPGTGEIPSEAREVLSRLDDLYRVIATRDQFWQYIRLWEITRALAFVYKGVMFVVPRLQPYSRMTPSNAKVIAYVNPPVIPKYESAVSQWAESTYGSAGYYNPLNFGKVVGAEVSIDIQREVLDFLVPVVKLTKYQDATLQLVTRLSKLGLCVFWVDIGRFYLIVENCSLTENIGSVYRMTKNGISLLQERV